MRELELAKACQLAEVDGNTILMINRQGLENMKRYSCKPELADQLLKHFPEKYSLWRLLNERGVITPGSFWLWCSCF